MNAVIKHMITLVLLISALAGCNSGSMSGKRSPATTIVAADPTSPTSSIGLEKRYIFYLHGKIIEDQGIPAISPDYGEYEYQAIIDRLRGYRFEVISEQRQKNTDGLEYARKTAGQITSLIHTGVPAKNITVVGASKGGSITIFISDILKNIDINYVILAACNPEMLDLLKYNHRFLYGNVLSIYDSADQLAGSCQEIFSLSEGKGLARHGEIILNVGTGHGILYRPLDEWIIPIIEWAGKP